MKFRTRVYSQIEYKLVGRSWDLVHSHCHGKYMLLLNVAVYINVFQDFSQKQRIYNHENVPSICFSKMLAIFST